MNIHDLLTSDSSPRDAAKRRSSLSATNDTSSPHPPSPTQSHRNRLPSHNGLTPGPLPLSPPRSKHDPIPHTIRVALPDDRPSKNEALESPSVKREDTTVAETELENRSATGTPDFASSDVMTSTEDASPKRETPLKSGAKMKQIAKKQIVVPPPTAGNVCYCGVMKEDKRKPMFQCVGCYKYFHQACLDALKQWSYSPLLGDDFYYFKCKKCSHRGETFKRLQMSWVDVIHVVLFNLSATLPPRRPSNDGRKYYSWKHDICTFIDSNWDKMWLKPRTATWRNSVASCLSTGDRFISGTKQFDNEQGMWALDSLAFPSAVDGGKRGRPIAYDMTPDGTLVEFRKRKRVEGESDSDSVSSVNYAKPKKVRVPSQHSAPDATGVAPPAPKRPKKRKIKRIRYDITELDLTTAIDLYPDVDNPRGPVVLWDQTTHSAPQMKIVDGGMTVSTDKGYRMAKASHGVWEGSWYYEVTINQHKGHTRIGWSQISGDLQAPCGYDQFSYSFRDSPGDLFHKSMRSKDRPDEYAVGYGPGDVLGMSIHLPRAREAAMDQLLRRLWDVGTEYRKFRSPPLEVVEDSFIKYYLNGRDLGVAFRGLCRGKYHPAISCYQSGSVTVNFGPTFAHDLPPGTRPFCEVDSVSLWADIRDGKVPTPLGTPDGGSPVLTPAGSDVESGVETPGGVPGSPVGEEPDEGIGRVLVDEDEVEGGEEHGGEGDEEVDDEADAVGEDESEEGDEDEEGGDKDEDAGPDDEDAGEEGGVP